MHLTNDELRHLATLVVEDLPFNEDDVAHMEHIGECDDCYRKIKVYIALFEAIAAEEVNLMASFTQEEKEQPENTAIISVVFVDAKALFKQLNSETAKWIFDAALSGVGQRALGETEPKEYRYEDIQNSETYIAYNEERKELTVQIDGRDLAASPSVRIRFSSGKECELRLERVENLYFGTLSNLSNESFEVIIKK